MKTNKNEKEFELNGITEDQAAQELIKNRDKILEDFATAYLAETKISPSEVELVSKQNTNGTEIETVYFFRKKVK